MLKSWLAEATKTEPKKVNDKKKTYNTRDSLVVTDPTTSLALRGLCLGERTGPSVFHELWSYVPNCLSGRRYDGSGRHETLELGHRSVAKFGIRKLRGVQPKPSRCDLNESPQLVSIVFTSTWKTVFPVLTPKYSPFSLPPTFIHPTLLEYS